ncbi:hypothetical protein GCM10011338_20240 [Alteromonas lipolytica]|nr:hypothetical protein GCM10011338_20240 [Alteromonas lipolytica]
MSQPVEEVPAQGRDDESEGRDDDSGGRDDGGCINLNIPVMPEAA